MSQAVEMLAKLEAFCKLLEDEQNQRASTQYPSLAADAISKGRRGYVHTGYDEGGRFWKVWRESGQKSVAYFVERDTGIIFGAKGWKAYNPARAYGTLDTINEWDWSEYYGVSKTGQSTLVPKGERK